MKSYIVYTPNEKNEKVNLAKDELCLFLEQAFGDKPDCQVGGEIKKGSICLNVEPKNAKDIKLLKFSGFYITTFDGSYYVYAKNGIGVLFGAYELLNRLVGFEAYAHEEIYVDKKTKVDFPEIDVMHEPTFEYRKIGYYNLSKYKLTAYRSRVMTEAYDQPAEDNEEYAWNLYNGYFATMFCHTTVTRLLPPEKDENGNLIHPEWYNDKLNQLCWTNPETTDALIEKLKSFILAHPYGKAYCVGMEDNDSYCTCEKCASDYKKYGVTGVHIRFINKVAKAIEEWRKEVLPEREFKIAMFAYLCTKQPPVVLNADGEYEPIDESVICQDNVILLNAPIDRCGYHSIYDKCNRDIMLRLKNWNLLCKALFIWDYHAYFDNYLLFVPDVPKFAEDIRFYKDCGAQVYFAETKSKEFTVGFVDLCAYLLSKLSYDASYDQEELTANFFKHYYKSVSDKMRYYYDRLINHYSELEKKYATLGPRGYHISYDVAGHPDVLLEVHWPKEFLLESDRILSDIISDVQKISDVAEREKLLRRVKIEQIMIKYLLIQIHTYFETEAEFERQITEFYQLTLDCGLIYFDSWPEGKTIKNLIGSWHNRYPARDDNK